MGQYDNPRLATKDGILTGPEASQAKDPSEWGELETGQWRSGEWSEMRASDCYLFHMQMRTFEIILQHKWEEFRPRPHFTIDEAESQTRQRFKGTRVQSFHLF